jgi:hypothetical protein
MTNGVDPLQFTRSYSASPDPALIPSLPRLGLHLALLVPSITVTPPVGAIETLNSLAEQVDFFLPTRSSSPYS